MRIQDAETVLKLHYDAVHKTAAKDYAAEILDQWSANVDEDRITAFLENPDREIRIVAVRNDQIAGFGCLVAEQEELRACYVSPDFARQGVGRALVQALEDRAVALGLKQLKLASSLTAAAFYRALGYEVLEHSKHRLRSGDEMNCIRMRRDLVP